MYMCVCKIKLKLNLHYFQNILIIVQYFLLLILLFILLFVIGELLTLEEAYTYLKTFMFPKEEMVETQRSLSQKSVSFNFHFLPAVTIFLIICLKTLCK